MEIIVNVDTQKYLNKEYKEFHKSNIIDMEKEKLIEKVGTIEPFLTNREISIFKVKTNVFMNFRVDSFRRLEERITEGSILLIYSTKNTDKFMLMNILHNIYFKIYKYFMFNKYLTVKTLWRSEKLV